MSKEAWVTDETEVEKPSSARVYDYLLGGYHNFEIDRRVAEMGLQQSPYLRQTAQICRAFLRRSIRYLVGQGIDQFLDIGSGIPTVGNVHEVAQAANPAARVVYVDIDPVAVAHSKAILAGNAKATAIRGDVRSPEEILGHPETVGLLNFSLPVAVVLANVLHFVTDDDATNAAVRRYRQVMAPGSFLVVVHGSPEALPSGELKALRESAARMSSTRLRTRDEILSFFDGLDLVEPGLVLIPLWHPEEADDLGLDRPEIGLGLAGVGRKP